jgi:hypothetical protein
LAELSVTDGVGLTEPVSRPVANGCLLAGTLIEIPGGVRDVARLRVGDVVMTSAGPRPLARVSVRIGVQSSVVRVKAGALAPNVPSREIVVGAEQQVMLQDGVLTTPVLVGFGVLANAGSIAREVLAGRANWYALEFEAHELVLASNVAISASRESGQAACLRMLPPGPALFALRARLAARVSTVLAGNAAEVADASGPAPDKDAEPGWVENEAGDAPDVRLVCDGMALASQTEDRLRVRYLLPAGSRFLRLASASRLPGGEDSRRIGVAVLHMALDGIPLSLTGMVIGDGFHTLEGGPAGEPGTRWRWTDGFARVVLPVSWRPRVLEVVIADWHRAS